MESGAQGGEMIEKMEGKEEEPKTMRWPTREELRAAREHLEAVIADMDLLREETLREIEEDKKAGRVRKEDPAEIDRDLRKRYAKIIRDYPLPESLFPGVVAEYRKYLEG